MALYRPNVWTQQPPGPVHLSQSNALAQGVIAAVSPPLGIGTVASGITQSTGQYGRHWSITTATTQAIDVTIPGGFTTGTNPVSAIAIFKSSGSLASQNLVNINYNGSTSPFILSLGNTGINSGCFVGYFSGAWKTSGNSTDVRNDGLWHMVGGAAVSGSQRCFLDGKLLSSATNTGTSANVNTNPISFGNYKNDSAALNGDFALGAVWNRFLSDAEFAELYRNPWQIFEPIKKRILFFSRCWWRYYIHQDRNA